MPDDLRLAPRLSEAALERMKRIERAAFYKTRKDGMRAEYVNVEAIWLLHGGRCCCDVVRFDAGCGGKPMDPEQTGNHPDAPTLAHVDARRRKLKGGHTPENCRWWRHECNAAMAKVEAHDDGVGNRMAVQRTLIAKPKEERTSGKIKQRAGPSALSKQHSGYKKPSWAKRGFGK